MLICKEGEPSDDDEPAVSGGPTFLIEVSSPSLVSLFAAKESPDTWKRTNQSGQKVHVPTRDLSSTEELQKEKV